MSVQALLLAMLLALLYSLGIAGLVYRLVGRGSPASAIGAIALGVGVAPFLAGLVTIAAIGTLGKSANSTYIALHFIFAVVLVLVSAKSILRAGQVVWGPARVPLRPAQPSWRSLLRIETVLVGVLLLQLAWLGYLVLAVPLIGNDPLEYAMVAKVLYERRSFDAYPLIEADPATGMYAPWTHPPLYVALIFLGYALQGGGELPGLMRLVPMYCIGAVLIVLWPIAVRAQPAGAGAKAALLTSIIVLSTPLVRDMVVEASIDALPILGLTLVFASASLFGDAALRSRIALTGVALGFSLWAHSSAILFPVLAAIGISTMRWFQRRPFTAECAGILMVGGVLGCLPYLRNLQIFGSPISDLPAVFALPQLDWEAYFTTGRGMSNLYDMVVVGVLRGWTAYAAFWLTFWLMTAGIALIVRDKLQHRTPDPGRAIPLIGAVAIVAAFHAGMLLSVLVGTTQMIKNARYLLPIVPLAALLGGFALSRIAHLPSLIDMQRTGTRITVAVHVDFGQRSQALSQIIIIGILFLSVNQVATGMAYWRSYLGSLGSTIREPERTRLAKFRAYRVQDYMRKNLPPEALVLSMRPADMYYGNHRMISYLDPRLVPAYKETDSTKLFQVLRALGVTHVYKPNYSLPVIYNSALMRVLADGELSRIVHSDSHYTIYELNGVSSNGIRATRSWNLSPAYHPWIGSSAAQVPLLADWCRTEKILVDSSAANPTVRRCSWAPAHRAVYVSGVGPPGGVDAEHFTEVQPGGLYRYKIDVSGEGPLRIMLYEKRGKLLSVEQIDDAVLTNARRTFSGMFRLPDDVTHIRLALSIDGAGQLSIHDIRLDALEAADAR